ncbi:helix-turn-helix transcriptional regulator [Sorangium sp. So ce1036]|uniref:helix-turn-helix domain-containing protein n=1 Tax=Sorangium sp. So ce1036 TaxID=3133328 RepID=UPI003F076314
MRTEGQLRLLKLTRKYTQARVARKCGVSQAVISLWISGKRKPDYENRKTIFEQYEIAMDAWDRAAEQGA